MPSTNEDEKEISLLRGLISMIKHLGLSIVGEGLETERHVEICSELKVDTAQGYYFAKPASSEEIHNSIIKKNMQIAE